MGRGIRFTTEFKRETVRLALSSGRPSRERGGQIHRRVLQSDPAALDARLPEPGPVRDGRPGVNKQLSTKPTQVQCS